MHSLLTTISSALLAFQSSAVPAVLSGSVPAIASSAIGRRRYCSPLCLDPDALMPPESILATPVSGPAASAAPPYVSEGDIMSEEQLRGCMRKSGIWKQELTEVPARGVFCARSLDLNTIRCIGYDMDYTLIDYRMEVWEARAYHYCKEHLRSKGFPVSGLQLDAELVGRGIIIDKEKGNLVKADRFGYVTRAYHGTLLLSEAEIAREARPPRLSYPPRPLICPPHG